MGERRNPMNQTVTLDGKLEANEASLVHVRFAVVLGIGGLALPKLTFDIIDTAIHLRKQASIDRFTYHIDIARLVKDVQAATTYLQCGWSLSMTLGIVLTMVMISIISWYFGCLTLNETFFTTDNRAWFITDIHFQRRFSALNEVFTLDVQNGPTFHTSTFG